MKWLEREFIAVPDSNKHELVYKWPDLNIRKYSRVIVNADQTALFVKSGQVLTELGPGRHRIDTDELPVLGAVIDRLSGGNFYRAELYFVSSREFPGVRFGGRLADVADPVTHQVVSLRVFGEFALTVRDPTALLTVLAGTADLSDPELLQRWSSEQLVKAMKIAVTRRVANGDWPIVGLSAHLLEIEAAVIRQSNIALFDYGLQVSRMGNFDISLDPADAARVKRLAKDIRYIQLTGDFERYAAGELALGASAGLAGGGQTGPSDLLGTALGLNAMNGTAASGASRDRPRGRPSSACPACGAATPADAGFCGCCGAAAAVQHRRECARCGVAAPPSSNFCAECGARLVAGD
ncbi:virion core protein (lumpy skin disease virus) [Nocardia neocaledoniensis NBRC 108232]|uniref:Membrane protease subunit (Stomatin/prohibitin family) n=1 Tax=Nocardia neocaledoniensis TaxID=236511 RepID=A0A317N0Y0_9NOCA|nr:SPFH domain-containing protein [Nocardia neocaledoniensis]PWV66971.1 membrane protease subunit (stomatin/prohibitin family) [Nocardia neocaledoniensis]GEM31292.1 virion core protein (lumpy skin disease virus) [Nocardia neocaledoniensis NBRC 108232]